MKPAEEFYDENVDSDFGCKRSDWIDLLEAYAEYATKEKDAEIQLLDAGFQRLIGKHQAYYEEAEAEMRKLRNKGLQQAQKIFRLQEDKIDFDPNCPACNPSENDFNDILCSDCSTRAFELRLEKEERSTKGETETDESTEQEGV